MCTGLAYKMMCGHYLVHWSSRCPRKCVLPDRRNSLACTCAQCDPEFNRSQILLRYGAERDRLTARLRAATLEGRLQDARALERHLRDRQSRQMQDLGRTRVRGLDPAVPVRFPGLYEQFVAENLGRPVDWDRLLNG